MFSVFKDINRFAKKWRSLDSLAVFCARILPYLLTVFLFFFYFWQKNIYLFFYAIISGLFARFIINELVHLFHKSRRPAYLEHSKTLIPVPKNYSFPSGHSSFFFGISFFLIFYNLYLGLVFVVLSFIIGTARVFCGVHWFRDIIGGFAAGLLSAIITYYLLIFFNL